MAINNYGLYIMTALLCRLQWFSCNDYNLSILCFIKNFLLQIILSTILRSVFIGGCAPNIVGTLGQKVAIELNLKNRPDLILLLFF